MTDLERRALLGDRQAQEECTRMGIALACPKCFKPVTVRGLDDWKPTFYDPDIDIHPYEFDCECGLALSTYKYNFKEALSDWNTRPAPPVGRCGECAAYVDSKCANTGYYKSETGFCDDFASKEGKENG